MIFNDFIFIFEINGFLSRISTIQASKTFELGSASIIVNFDHVPKIKISPLVTIFTNILFYSRINIVLYTI